MQVRLSSINERTEERMDLACAGESSAEGFGVQNFLDICKAYLRAQYMTPRSSETGD